MRTFARNGLRFDVRDSGGPGSPVVVCLHGFPQDSTAYDGVAPLLVDAGFRVLAPDQRGYSPGARPPDTSAYRLTELVADVLALIDAAGADRAHVVGHDWGGAVAWAVAGRHPDRVASVVSLSTPHPAAMRAAAVRGTQALRSAYMAMFQLPRLPEAVLRAGHGHALRTWLRGSGLPRTYADHYTGRMLEPGGLEASLAWYRAMRPAGRARAGRVRVPAGLLAGDRDPVFAPAAVRGTGDHVAAPFTLRTLEDATHWLPETRPAEVAAMVQEVAAGAAQTSESVASAQRSASLRSASDLR